MTVPDITWIIMYTTRGDAVQRKCKEFKGWC